MLRALPQGLGALKDLRRLALGDCWKVTSLPAGLSALSVLESLEMWETAISYLPQAALSTLTALRTLVWNGDRVPYDAAAPAAPVPDALCALRRLETLVAGGEISSLPADIGAVSALRTLSVMSREHLRVDSKPYDIARFYRA